MPPLKLQNKFTKFVHGLSGKHSGAYKGNYQPQRLTEKFTHFMSAVKKRRSMK